MKDTIKMGGLFILLVGLAFGILTGIEHAQRQHGEDIEIFYHEVVVDGVSGYEFIATGVTTSPFVLPSGQKMAEAKIGNLILLISARPKAERNDFSIGDDIAVKFTVINGITATQDFDGFKSAIPGLWDEISVDEFNALINP